MFGEDKLYKKFEKIINRNSMRIKKKIDTDFYIVEINQIEYKISLENLRKDYERDKNDEAIEEFVKSIKSSVLDVPNFSDVKNYIRISIEQSKVINDDYIYQKITDEISKTLVYVSQDERLIYYINKATMKEWNKTEKELFEVANRNMNEILKEFEVEINIIDKMKLGMIPLKKEAFKSSIITASGFKEKMKKSIGWPVYLVIPARDFIYVVSKDDKELIGRTGKIVLREYNESGYPLTKEVFEINDDGIKVIGSF